MNNRQIRIFHTVALEGSITKASEKLHIAQPSVSSAIIQLENELGYKLFFRIQRRLYLSPNGKEFLDLVTAHLRNIENFETIAKDIPKVPKIKLGSSITLATDFLPELISMLKKKQPKLEYELVISNAQNIEELLLKQEIDLGFIEGRVDNKKVHHIRMSKYKIKLYAAAHKEVTKKMNNFSDLLGENFLLRESGSAIREVFDKTLALRNIKVYPIIESVDSQALINIAGHGLGITCLPEVLVNDAISKGVLAEVPVVDLDLENTNHLLFIKGRQPTENSLNNLIFESIGEINLNRKSGE